LGCQQFCVDLPNVTGDFHPIVGNETKDGSGLSVHP